ncbi:hypothetical protein EUGRSUZ_A00276 [Eucalyptus grandis]|uniref:Uncharacterized protein n=2 Tax=Eucalyptus grandis TaxID=71139 RepID=A0ACC3LYQ9_EUCGR|nr:hypothetical protein EUGRSUZ_A00276 [Eucalyptus grandis]
MTVSPPSSSSNPLSTLPLTVGQPSTPISLSISTSGSGFPFNCIPTTSSPITQSPNPTTATSISSPSLSIP